MKKLLFAAALLCPGTSLVSSAEAVCEAPAPQQLLCSDPGRSCSVDRNCCSGTCSKGSCQ